MRTDEADRVFPILYATQKKRQMPRHWPASVPWALVERCRERAWNNHSQTIERLAERGGLCPQEMCAVLADRPWHVKSSMNTVAAVEEILAAIQNYEEAYRAEER